MTNIHLLEIGDRVTISVPRDLREWTSRFNDIPDGTVGVVCGFHESVVYRPRVPSYGQRPGVYYSRGAARVWLQDGRVIESGGFASLIDTEEERRRDKARRDDNGILQPRETRISDLPDTPYWELDEVLVKGHGYGHVAHALSEPYGQGDVRYSVNLNEGGSVYTSEKSMRLVKRGNVWRYYHAKPLRFADIMEEATFFELLGHTTEVRNPESGDYNWSMPEAREALRNGTGHSVAVSQGFLGAGPHVSVRRFHDEALGARVAAASLEALS